MDEAVVQGMLGAEAHLRYFRKVQGQTFGYAEFETKDDLVCACNALNNVECEGALFRACQMPEDPIVVAVSRDPHETKFRADLNKSIKTRAHDRLVLAQEREKRARKLAKQHSTWQLEAPSILRREKEKSDAVQMQEKLMHGGIIMPTFPTTSHHFIPLTPSSFTASSSLNTQFLSRSSVNPPSLSHKPVQNEVSLTGTLSAPKSKTTVTYDGTSISAPETKAGTRFDIANRDLLASQVKSELARMFGGVSDAKIDAMFKTITLESVSGEMMHRDGFFVSVQLHIKPEI